MDKPGPVPYSNMTRRQLRVALQETRQAYHDYQFTAEQKIKDLQGQVTVLLKLDEKNGEEREQ